MVLFLRNGKLVVAGGKLRQRGQRIVTITPSDLTFSASFISERSPVGATVGRVDVYDPDDTSWTFEIVNQSTSNLFVFAGGSTASTGGHAIVVTDRQVPARSISQVQSITIRVTDSRGASYTETFTLTVLEASVNPAPVDITLSKSDIDELAVSGTTVGRLNASDPGDAQWTFEITAQSTQGLFTLTRESYLSSEFSTEFEGQQTGNTIYGGYADLITTSVVPTYSSATSHSVTVRATDPVGGSFSRTFPISVNQVIVNPVPADIVLSPTQIDEMAASGTTLGQLDVTDPGDVSWTFEIVDQSTLGLFVFQGGSTQVVAPSATVVTALQVPSYDVSRSHTLTLRATDPAGGVISETFTIAVRNTFGDTLLADFAFWPTGGRFNGISEGQAASTTTAIGSIDLVNASNGQWTGYTWSILTQSNNGLFSLGSVTTDNNSRISRVSVFLAKDMPAWTQAVQVQTFVVKATHTSGVFATATITVICLRNGAPTVLYPPDGYTIWDSLRGPVDLIWAGGCQDRSIIYSIVNDARFGIRSTTTNAILTVTDPLAPGSYDVRIRAANSAGSTDFVRRITVRPKAELNQTYPWYQFVSKGLTIPAPTTTLPKTLRIRNESSTSTAANEPVWFYLSFPPGLISTSERPTFTVAGNTLSAQIDGVRYWRDSNNVQTSFQGGRFCLNMPSSIPASGSVDVVVGKQAGPLATTEFQSAASSKTAIANAAWNVRLNIGGTEHRANLNLTALNDSRCRTFAAGANAHTFRCITKFFNTSTNAEHAELFVTWYGTVYQSGIIEVMPVVHNSWYGHRGRHTITAAAVYQGNTVRADWFPSSFDHYGHGIWYAGDEKVRPLRSNGTVGTLYADYSQVLTMLWEAGAFMPYSNTLNPAVPTPANPNHTPQGRPFFQNDPNQGDGALTNCNYGNAFGHIPDWSARALMTGSASWFNVNRVVAADWGVYHETVTDPDTWDVRGNHDGWHLGVQNKTKYAPIAVNNWVGYGGWDNSRVGGGPTGLGNWNEQHRADPFFYIAYATARPWWIDAMSHIALWSLGLEPSGYPNNDNVTNARHPGYRHWKIGNKIYYTGCLRTADRHAAWTMRHATNAEYLHGDGEPRQNLFHDIVGDPYAALKSWCVDGEPRYQGDGRVESNLVCHRPAGFWFARNYTLQPWEGNYLSSTIIMDVMRRRPILKPYVEGFALYYLTCVTFGLGGAPVEKGGTGCPYFAWLNDFNFGATRDDETTVFLRARNWSEVARYWKDPAYKIQPISPGDPPVVNGMPAWYTSSGNYCRAGTFQDINGGFSGSTRPIYSRAVAIMGVKAGIPNAADALANYKRAINYNDGQDYYTVRNQDRWFVVE